VGYGKLLNLTFVFVYFSVCVSKQVTGELHNPNDFQLDVCLSVHSCICIEKKNLLDVTE